MNGSKDRVKICFAHLVTGGGKGRFPLQSFCPRGRNEHVSTFAIGV